jgi:FlaG/FlaF family flagellin (archaellin)
MKNLQKGSVAVILLVIIVVVLLGVIGWMYTKQSTKVDRVSNSTSTINTQAETLNSNTFQSKINQTTDTAMIQPVSNPSIKITSLNDGEILNQNTSYTLAWTYSGLNNSDSITIGFRTPNENVCWAGKTIASNRSYSFVPNQVKCEGSISNLKNGGQFKAQLIVDKYSDGRGVADTSDNYFTIKTQ